ncbi:hypothetical protein OHA44_36960 [Streptomyces sp. NBC_00144]|uniref:hypothetical protein n=1 Tax=Streptomyces sp. NBC_00144 TaxID=2975665 RepID=UPI003249DCD9
MEPGELIAGRYELIKRLGRGGMGEVWAARDRDLHRDIALKLLVPDEDVLPELVQRFAREAVAGAQINHPAWPLSTTGASTRTYSSSSWKRSKASL